MRVSELGEVKAFLPWSPPWGMFPEGARGQNDGQMDSVPVKEYGRVLPRD